ncbi:hypothetical protein CBS101457_001784 [Exobasidium rhododendri]|nr:hypothetical protein CBS101457_001784 [Exobasidium rhododendri]
MHLSHTPKRGDATSPKTPEPRTPVKSGTTSAHPVDISLFDGVPGAPGRKLRSHQDEEREERSSGVNSVARLIDFGQERRGNKEAIQEGAEEVSTSSSLASPILLECKSKQQGSAMKRSFSSSTSEAELLGFPALRALQKSKRAKIRLDSFHDSLLPPKAHFMDVDKHQTIFATSRSHSSAKKIGTSPRRTNNPSSRLAQTFQICEPFLPQASFLASSSSVMARSNTCLSHQSSTTVSPWEDSFSSSGDYFDDWSRRSLTSLA